MLTISGLTTNYGGAVRVLEGVDLEVVPGSVTAVLGSNGAGKSTLLRAISGTLPLHKGAICAGSIRYGDTDITRMAPARIARLRVVHAPEGRQIFGRMSVEENLRVGALVTPSSRRTATRDHVLDLFPRLRERLGQRAGLLSGGEQQMLAIGRALMAEPEVLLLDEPSLGLAPLLVEQIGDLVTVINQSGTTVVLVEQNAAMAMRVATHAAVLEVGSVAASGSVDDVRASTDIERLYLGAETTHLDLEVETEAVPDAQLPVLARWQR